MSLVSDDRGVARTHSHREPGVSLPQYSVYNIILFGGGEWKNVTCRAVVWFRARVCSHPGFRDEHSTERNPSVEWSERPTIE